METTQANDADSIKTSVMNKAGYVFNTKVCGTMQGEIWQSVEKLTGKRVVIKATNIGLHENGITFVNGAPIKVQENIVLEKSILKYLSDDNKCPKSIVKYIDSFKSNDYYFLVMEHGGFRLFDFIVNVHRFISSGRLSISEWHKLAKIICKQMIECVAYCHSKNVVHFDISLENFLVNDIQIDVHKNGKQEKITFCIDEKDSVQIKLCDFGLAQLFKNKHSKANDIRFHSNKFCGKENYQCPEITNRKNNFNAKLNDIWCLGTVFWMIIVGASPWRYTSNNDALFKCIIDGNIKQLLVNWNKLSYVNQDLIKLFRSIFQYEEKRIDIEQIKKCSWLNDSHSATI